MGNRRMFVGLDVHQETIAVSVAAGARGGDVRHYGVIASDLEPLDTVIRARRAPDRVLQFVSEAGPCGFGIYRHRTSRGERCAVVSPSMVPTRSGDRVKTDRRDSATLARLHRAGEAQLSLTTRFRRLVIRGNAKPKVATAIARELAGFIWAIAQEAKRKSSPYPI